MNIVKALRRSKITGEAFCCDHDPGGPWIKYDEGWTYRIPAASIVSDEWYPLCPVPWFVRLWMRFNHWRKG